LVNLPAGTKRVYIAPLAALARVAFSAHKNGTNQTNVANNATTAITWSTELFDVGGYFTANAWTPPAGLYQVTACLGWNTGFADQEQLIVHLRKGGAAINDVSARASGTGGLSTLVSAIVQVNAPTPASRARRSRSPGRRRR